jgi:hypothetical protein
VLKLYLADVAQVARTRSVVGPSCLLVVRWFHVDQPLIDPEQCADNWFAAHEQDIRRMTAYNPIVFEGCNEIGDVLADLYARFEVRRLARLHGVGARSAVGSWSAGTPSETTWPKYKTALDAMIAGDVVSAHEYWSDRVDLENRWHVGRFAQTGIAPFLVGKQLVITECGRDYMPDTKKGAAGWRRTCSADEFLGDLRRLGEIYDQYPQVVGATVFQRGLSEWGMFEMASLWPRVVAEYALEGYAGAAPAPVPPTGTTPPSGMTDQAIGDYMQQFVVPLNPIAALGAAARAMNPGAVEVSPEKDFQGERVQVFRFPGNAGVQHLFAARIPDWANVRHWTRAN